MRSHMHTCARIKKNMCIMIDVLIVLMIRRISDVTIINLVHITHIEINYGNIKLHATFPCSNASYISLISRVNYYIFDNHQ